MLGVEIPVADVSSTSQVELAWNVARSLTKLDDEASIMQLAQLFTTPTTTPLGL